MFKSKLINWFPRFLSKSSNRKHSHYFRHSGFSYLIKLIICLLCLNILVTSSYHVVCIELSSDGITTSHLQLHDCHYPQDNRPGTFIHSDNQKTSHDFLVSSQGKAQSCPECIDEHIQFIKIFPKINPDTASLFKTVLPTVQNNTNQFFYTQANSSVPKKYSSSLSSFRSSVIRSTIMLI